VTPGPSVTVTATASVAELAVGTVLAQRYRIDALLGVGGMGMVYRAHDLALGIDVAVKLLRPELSARPEAFQRFRQELLLARQVSSPHVLRIHDIACDGAHWFITMDYVDGEGLDHLLEREIRLPPERALVIAAQLAQGLAAAHAQQVVHRDLKPANVLIDREGRARISDFGVARSLGSTGFTHTGAVVGTPDYLSPEQARGERVDARSDLYALGVLLYEMLAGQLPFPGATPAEMLAQRIGGRFVPLRRIRPELPVWVERLVARLLSANPRYRFQRAQDVLTALEQRHVARDWRAWLRPGLASLAVLLMGLLGWQWWPAQTSAPPPPQRLVVWATAGEGANAQVAAALAETLRQALGADAAIADGLRTAQAQQRSGVDAAALRQELPARQWLQLALHTQPDGHVVSAQLSAAGGAPRELGRTPALAAPTLALTALRPLLADGLGQQMPALDDLLPREDATLAALGEALILRQGGRLDAAKARLQALLQAEPDYALGWLTLAETCLLAGDAATGAAAVAAGQRLSRPLLSDAFALLDELLAGRLDAAERRLRARLAIAPGDALATLRLAEVLGDRGEFDAADALLVELLAADPLDSRAWFLRGKFAVLRGPLQAAVDEYLVRAVLLAKRARNRFAEAEAVNALGIAYARLGQVRDADEQYRRALELRRDIGHRRGIANSLRNLAQLAMVQGRAAEAEQILGEARELFAELADGEGLAAIDNELGLIAEERGDYAGALAAYRQALRAREALGDRRAVAESLNNIGFAEFQLGDYDGAQAFWERAQSAFAALDDHNGAVRTAQNLGMLDLVRGRWHDAEGRLNQSLALAEAQQLAEERAVSQRYLAELALWRGELAAAQRHWQAAREDFAAREDRRGLIDIAWLEISALLAIGADGEARARLATLQTDLTAASGEQQAQAALLEAELLRRAGDSTAMAAALQRATQLADAAGVRALASQIALARDGGSAALGEALQQLGHRVLWLQWAEAALSERKVGNESAVALYRRAVAVLPDTESHLRAWRLHRLGARALRAAGEDAAAQTAAEHAERSLEKLLQATPAAWRDALRRHAAQDETR